MIHASSVYSVQLFTPVRLLLVFLSSCQSLWEFRFGPAFFYPRNSDLVLIPTNESVACALQVLLRLRADQKKLDSERHLIVPWEEALAAIGCSRERQPSFLYIINARPFDV